MTTAVPANHEEQENSEKTIQESTEEKNGSSAFEIVKAFLNAVFSTALVIAGLVVVTIWLLPVLVGAKPITVLSGSMEPTFSAGDVIWVDTDKSSVEIGAIVVFHPEAYSNDLITHRVIATNTGSKKTYTTQGDANNSADDPIVEDQIVGVVKSPTTFIGLDSGFMSFPKAGYLQQHLFTIGIVVIGIVVVMWIVSACTSKLNKQRDKNNEQF